MRKYLTAEQINATMAALRMQLVEEPSCDHKNKGTARKYDSGRCPVLCEGCRLIIGYWTVVADGTIVEHINDRYL